MKLGAICDDFTGTSDLGLTLAEGGMHTVQFVGTPDGPAPVGVEAGLISLRSRSAPVGFAVAQSIEAWRWLRDQGCEQFMFKYCSTFDSTPQGNIGPVIDALIEQSGTRDPVIVCPAFPTAARTVYQGHLFVGDRLLSETGMRDHPITPMTDPDIRRWLARQTARAVGHLPLERLRAGRVREALQAEAAAGRQIVVCDAVTDDDLRQLGHAAEGFDLITGGSGIALALPERFKGARGEARPWRGAEGRVAVLSGSCSQATRGQIQAHVDQGGPARQVAVDDLIAGRETPTAVLEWVLSQSGIPVVYTSDEPERVRAMQQRFGSERSAAAVEHFFGELARALVAQGFNRLISAGGETSGAVVGALDAKALEIGPMIAPGVPALRLQGANLVVALKSGNLGGPDFFARAATILAAHEEPA
ncbi:MAG: 3-oxo-tetronate kinase [Salinisphaera sp.]|uniref:3-oxo-tetronate kinase n=1 Tax=Salinisphaera sp. TaxID=1914330 RepID=UPI003C7EC120